MGEHAMLDIETLGIGPNRPIFQIGLSTFNYQHQLKVDLDLLDVMLTTGFAPDMETVKWWMDQPDPFVDTKVRLREGLIMVTAWINDHDVEYLWANSPSFDCVMLRQHYDVLGMRVPWSYRKEMCFRTMKTMAKANGWTWDQDVDIVHDALIDAVYQIQQLKSMGFEYVQSL